MVVNRPVLLDLFCGAGGAARGYADAGFEVVGVDIKPQPNYPFHFIQADAIKVLEALSPYIPTIRMANVISPMWTVAAIHASPTCQTRSRATAWRGRREDHPDLLTPTLRALARLSVPWVVENVPEAVWDGTMRGDLILCGSQFGLAVKRHRAFEFNWAPWSMLPPCHHHKRLLPFEHKAERAYADAMGCTWMTKFEARQAIPPAYTRFIGEQLLAHITASVTS